MKSPGQMRAFPVLHALAMLALAAGWIYYCWRESLARFAGPRRGPAVVIDLDRMLATLNATLADVLLGCCTVFLLAIGTGLYVRRLQTWIDAHTSGDAVALGGADLKDQALAANAAAVRERRG
jgi:hypothetical protein